jgi:hypothetical protein
MFKKKNRSLSIQKNDISVKDFSGEDYISLTDMLRNKDGDFFISDWLRNRNTIEFLGVWESMYNSNFNYGEFAIIKSQAGLNSYKISVKEWVDKTNAIGLRATAGRYGGTYAHKDIAFEFGTWISPTFKLYLIKEYQRLKEIETNQYNLEWNVRRVLASSTYTIHTDAIKKHIIPNTLPWNANYKYADEADLINLALFGITAKEWRIQNPSRAKDNENLRDSASINELLILENLQLKSAELLAQGLSPEERFKTLQSMAKSQRSALSKIDPIKALKKLDNQTYLDSGSQA